MDMVSRSCHIGFVYKNCLYIHGGIAENGALTGEIDVIDLLTGFSERVNIIGQNEALTGHQCVALSES